MQITLEPNQSKIVTLNPVYSDGSPATLESAPSWIILNGNADVQLAPGGLSATISALNRSPGRTIIAVSANAGREQVGFILGVDIIPFQAVSLAPSVV